MKDQGQNPETPTFRDEEWKIPVKMKGRYNQGIYISSLLQ